MSDWPDPDDARLLDAVDALTLPERVRTVQHSLDGGEVCSSSCPRAAHTHVAWSSRPSLLVVLEAMIHATMATTSGAAASQLHTRGVLDSDALFQFARIRSTIADWARLAHAREVKDAAAQLRAWYVVYESSRPEPAAERWHVRVMQGWASTIRDRMDPWAEILLRQPCPNPDCPQGRDEVTGRPLWWDRRTGQATTDPLVVMYRPEDDRGPSVAAMALDVASKARSRCRACGTEWSARALAWELEHADGRDDT